MAETGNAPLDYHEYKDMVHAWMFLNLPESRKARKQILDLILDRSNNMFPAKPQSEAKKQR